MGIHTATVSGNVDTFAFSRLDGPSPAPAPDAKVEAEQRAADEAMKTLDTRLAEPLTRDDALKLRDELTADESWSKRFLAGSPERLKQMQKLNSIINDNPNRQSDAVREIEHLREKYDLPTEAIDHVRDDKPVTAAEKYAARQKKREMLSDQEFARNYLSGSLREQRIIKMLDIILVSPLIEDK